jgi:hypothetical protein
MTVGALKYFMKKSTRIGLFLWLPALLPSATWFLVQRSRGKPASTAAYDTIWVFFYLWLLLFLISFVWLGMLLRKKVKAAGTSLDGLSRLAPDERRLAEQKARI